MRTALDEVTRRVSTRLPLLLAILATGVLLAACGSDSDEGGNGGGESAAAKGASGEPEQKEVTIGILPTPGYASVPIAIERGFFEEEGLQVETQVMGPGTSVSGTVGGTYDIGGINWIAFLLALNRGVELQAVSGGEAAGPGYGNILVKEDSPYRNMADLVGKKVGVIASPGHCDLIPLDDLQKKDVEGKPEFVNLALPDTLATIQRGGVAGACVPEPFLSLAEQQGGFRSVFDLFTGPYEGFPIFGFGTSADFAEENPKTIGAVQRGLDKAFALINRDESVVRDILPRFTEIPEEVAQNFEPLSTYPDNTDPPEKLEALAQVIQRAGLVEGEVEVPFAGSDAP